MFHIKIPKSELYEFQYLIKILYHLILYLSIHQRIILEKNLSLPAEKHKIKCILNLKMREEHPFA